MRWVWIWKNLLVAGAAPGALGAAAELGGGEAVRDLVADGPGRVVGAGEGGAAAVAARLGVGVGEGVVVLVAGAGGRVDRGLAAPGARGLAAVPVYRFEIYLVLASILGLLPRTGSISRML